MLKPIARASVETLIWLDTIARPQLVDSGLRLALPLRGEGGTVAIDGWTATTWLDGRPTAGGWEVKADIARRFAQAFSKVNPGLMPSRDDPWARAEAAAWDGGDNTPLRHHPLSPFLCPVAVSPAVVHGDIAGNILFAPGQLPAVIDLSLYARPVEWSVAVLGIDAVCFQDASLKHLDTLSTDPAFPQYLARALLFRLTTDVLLGGQSEGVYDQAVAHLLRRLRVR